MDFTNYSSMKKEKKKVIFVDDHLILLNEDYGGEFGFAKPNGEEIWVPLLEKAYAKYEGGYSNIIGGIGSSELSWLTGAVTRDIFTNDRNCWNELHDACKAGYIITSGSNQGTGNHDNKSPYGIAHGHAYSILDAKEYKSNNQRIKLLKMRNPWGKGEWTGPYCDSSSCWTPELKKFFEFKAEKEDGIFFIPFENFLQEFENFTICLIGTKK